MSSKDNALILIADKFVVAAVACGNNSDFFDAGCLDLPGLGRE